MPFCLSPSPPPAHEVAVTAAYRAQLWMESVGDSDRGAVEIAGAVRLPPGFEIGLGARRLFGTTVAKTTAWEGFLRAQGGPRVGCWAPAAGLELGVTGALQQDWPAIEESFFYQEFVKNGTRDVVYAAFIVTPLRFRLGPVSVAAGSLSFGSSLPNWGRAVRIEVGLLDAGWVF